MSEGRLHLSRSSLESLIQSRDLTRLDAQSLVSLFRGETILQDHLPDGQLAIDPRNGDRVLFNPARARRPHDHKAPASEADSSQAACPICAGRTTGVIDAAPLSEGWTFINKNLYPMLYPFENREVPARGLHFLQWTSSFHDQDWHNMPLADRRTVLERLAALERKFIEGDSGLAPSDGGPPFVSIIKNAGAEVGASLSHGHQQIAVSNTMPRRLRDNLQFENENGAPFSHHLLTDLEPSLVVEDYGSAVLMVPPFMKRPFDMILVNRRTERSYLHQLDGEELEAIARGWHDALRAFHSILPRLGREVAYNVTLSNGPGAGLYLEFLPYSQTTGGFELLGLYVCQGSPASAAEDLRRSLAE